jgi:hypothetical protein
MSLFGFNFTKNDALDYIKKNWKPGKLELTYVLGILIIFIIAEVYDAQPIPTMESPTGGIGSVFAPTDVPIPDYNALAIRNITVSVIETFAAVAFTFLYFRVSDKKVSTALRWGAAYAIPVTLLFFITWVIDSDVQGVVGSILYLPATFLYGLLLTGGLYLLLLYRPKIIVPIAGYVIMLLFFVLLDAAIYGGFSIYTAWGLTDAVIGLSLIGLYLSIKDKMTLPYPPILLFLGIGLGFMIIDWVSDLVYLRFMPYYLEFLAFTLTGVVLYLLPNVLPAQFGVLKPQETLPPPPPPPPPEPIVP